MRMTTSLIAVAALLLVAPALALADDEATAGAAKPSQATTTNEPANCVRDTGSRIRRHDGECNGEPGRSYSHEELESTGEVNLGAALRRIDPSVTISR